MGGPNIKSGGEEGNPLFTWGGRGRLLLFVVAFLVLVGAGYVADRVGKTVVRLGGFGAPGRPVLP